jgi:hypothetical protein
MFFVIALIAAFVVAILVALKRDEGLCGWAFALCIPGGIISFFVTSYFTRLVPTSTVVKSYTRQLVELNSSDKFRAQASFMYVFGIVGAGSASADEQYTYEFWAQNEDRSASHFKLQDGADTVRVFQDAAAGKGTWTVQVITTGVPDQNNRWYDWGFKDEQPQSTTINYFHVPPGTIVQQFKLQ